MYLVICWDTLRYNTNQLGFALKYEGKSTNLKIN